MLVLRKTEGTEAPTHQGSFPRSQLMGNAAMIHTLNQILAQPLAHRVTWDKGLQLSTPGSPHWSCVGIPSTQHDYKQCQKLTCMMG